MKKENQVGLYCLKPNSMCSSGFPAISTLTLQPAPINLIGEFLVVIGELFSISVRERHGILVDCACSWICLRDL